MARKRMVDPSIWTNEGMAELSLRQQLLYIGLFSNADDDGRLKAPPATIRMMLPTVYGGVALDEIEIDLLCVMGVMTKLVRYQHDGNPYLAFLNYRDWQQIQHPTKSKLPPPPDAVGVSPHGALIEPSPPPAEMPVRTHGALNEDSLRSTPQVNVDQVRVDQGSLGGATGADAPPPPAPDPTGTPPTPPRKTPPRKYTCEESGFAPSDEDRAWCASEYPAVDIDAETEIFRDHYRANGERRSDWRATWKNWMRRTPQFNARPAPTGNGPPARASSRDGKLPGREAAVAAARILGHHPTVAPPEGTILEAEFRYTRKGAP